MTKEGEATNWVECLCGERFEADTSQEAWGAYYDHMRSQVALDEAGVHDLKTYQYGPEPTGPWGGVHVVEPGAVPRVRSTDGVGVVEPGEPTADQPGAGGERQPTKDGREDLRRSVRKGTGTGGGDH